MDIKILDSFQNVPMDVGIKFVGTHNGIFHSDEVVACAILYLLDGEHTMFIRSRNRNVLASCDICVDVGGGVFDHHQKGFSACRKNGIKYASAGLVWREYGKHLIEVLGEKYFPGYEFSVRDVFDLFDHKEISLVDCEDNGIDTNGKTHSFSFIPSFLPIWTESNYNEKFADALTATVVVLEERLKTFISDEVARVVIRELWSNDNLFADNILEIPSQTINWVGPVIEINHLAPSDPILFVIFPYPDGGWAAQCVPPSLENKFDQLVPFPKDWAGLTLELPEFSGVEGATFCHNGRFFAKATTKEAIIALCKKAYEREMFYAQFEFQEE